MLTIEPATIEDYAPYLVDMRRSNLLPPKPGTETYCAVTSDGTIAGLAGLLQTGPTVAQFRADYVPPPWRGMGVWQRLCFDYRMALCRERGITLVRLTATTMILPAWLRRGARIIRQYKIAAKLEIDVPDA